MFRNPAKHVSLVYLLLSLLFCITGTAYAAHHKAIIDVLLVFDKSSQEYISAGIPQALTKEPVRIMSIEESATQAIQQINTTMANSGLGEYVEFRLAGIVKTPYRSTCNENGFPREGETEDALNILMGHVPGVLEQREQTKADLIIMFTHYTPTTPSFSVGGAIPFNLANLYQKTPRELIGKGYCARFHITSIHEGDLTFAHEVCHLLGAGHSTRQKRQCGPQAESDAAAQYCGTGKQFATLLAYRKDIDTDTGQEYGFCTHLNVLSHPGIYTYSNGSSGTEELSVGDEAYYNNASVVKRHASAIAAYNISGNEKIINDTFREALPIPALVPFKEKVERYVKSYIYSNIDIAPDWQDLNRQIHELLSPATQEESTLADIQIPAPTTDSPPKNIGLELFREVFHQDKLLSTYISCVYGSNINATTDEGEQPLPQGRGKTVWYQVTPPVPGDIEVGILKDSCAEGFSPVLGIFRGSRVSSLTPVNHHEVEDQTAQFAKIITANVDKDETLFIAVDSSNSVQSNFVLVVRHRKGTYTAPPPAPATPDAWDKTDYLLLCGGISLIAVSLLMGRYINTDEDTEDSHIFNPFPNHPLLQKTLVLRGTLSNGSEKEYRIDISQIAATKNYYIGREQTKDTHIHLLIPDHTISAKHAVLKVRYRPDNTPYLLIGDAGSSNGTTLNGLTTHEEDACVEVTPNMVVRFAACEFVLTIES